MVWSFLLNGKAFFGKQIPSLLELALEKKEIYAKVSSITALTQRRNGFLLGNPTRASKIELRRCPKPPNLFLSDPETWRRGPKKLSMVSKVIERVNSKTE
jgi:hypothetical protein